MKKFPSKHQSKGFGGKKEPPSRPKSEQLAQTFHQAVTFHRKNKLDEALELYQQILSYRPNHADTLVNLATLYKTLGKIPDAISLYRRALESKPDNSDTWYNLGNTLQLQGEREEAICCYRKSLKLRPNFGLAYFNLGKLFQDKGDLAEAENYYKKALKTMAKFPPLHTNLGNVARACGRINEAIIHHQKAIQLDQNYAEAHYNLGNAFREGKAYDLAIKSYLLSLKLRANFPEAWFGLANVYQILNNLTGAEGALNLAINYNPNFTEAYLSLAVLKQNQGKCAEAENVLIRGLDRQTNKYKILNLLGFLYKLQRRADLAEKTLICLLENNPKDGVSYCNLGTLYNDLGLPEKAIDCLKKAIDNAQQNNISYLELAQINLGCAFVETRRLSQAIVHCQEVLKINSKNPLAYINMGFALHYQGKIAEAIGCFQNTIAIAPDYHEGHSNLLYALNYDTKQTPESITEAHFKWGKGCKFESIKTKKKTDSKRIKIGYISADFYQRPLADFIEPILVNHDQNEFDIFCYSNLFLRNNKRESIAELPNHWRDVYHSSDQQASELIKADELDILIDLSGHTPHNRLPLLARKPALVQISYLGYPFTTGLESIDYYLTDSLADPPGLTESYYTEKLLRLPNSFLTFQPPENSPPVTGLPAKETKKITFGSFNSVPTLTPDAISIWSNILKTLPDSQLVLKSRSFGDRTTVERYLTLFAHYGIDSRRVELISPIANGSDHLAGYAGIDIALDPFPNNGTIATCEAMWMGVPVITLAGNTHAGRVGVSLLTNVGLTEFIAQDTKEYVSKAVALARDLNHLSQLRATLRERMTKSPLCDVRTHTQAIEAIYHNVVSGA